MEEFRKHTLDLTKEIEANAKLELENLQAFSSNEEKIHRQVRVCVEDEFILQTAQQDLRVWHVKCLQYGPAVLLCSSLSCALCPRSSSGPSPEKPRERLCGRLRRQRLGFRKS